MIIRAKLLDAAPNYIAAISFLALLLGILHEIGYFSIIGLHLLAMASPADYLASLMSGCRLQVLYFSG